jgi:hypothetical protein
VWQLFGKNLKLSRDKTPELHSNSLVLKRKWKERLKVGDTCLCELERRERERGAIAIDEFFLACFLSFLSFEIASPAKVSPGQLLS